MGGHKFKGNFSRLDSPKRHEIMPPNAMIAALGDIEEGIAVADLGCGTGFLSIPLARHIDGQGVVYAVDINPEMLAVLKERADDLSNLRVIQSTENSIPIDDGTIDASFLVTVFHELDDPAAFMTEVKRISKPHHRVIIVDWTQVEGDMGPPLDERIPEEEVIAFFEGQGYKLQKKFELSLLIYGLVFEN